MPELPSLKEDDGQLELVPEEQNKEIETEGNEIADTGEWYIYVVCAHFIFKKVVGEILHETYFRPLW